MSIEGQPTQNSQFDEVPFDVDDLLPELEEMPAAHDAVATRSLINSPAFNRAARRRKKSGVAGRGGSTEVPRPVDHVTPSLEQIINGVAMVRKLGTIATDQDVEEYNA